MQLLSGSGAFTDQDISIINSNFSQAASNIITGNKIYLDPANTYGTSGDTNSGLSPQSAVVSLNTAYNLLRDGANDGIVLLSNGATSSTARLNAAFTWAKSCAHFVGSCAPTIVGQRARIAPGTTATAFKLFFTVSGNGCMFANLEFFQGFAVGTTAEICMTVSGNRNAFINCQIAGMADTDGAGQADAASRNLKITGAENTFSSCWIGDDTAVRTNANASLELAGNVARNQFNDCIFPAYVGSGGAPVFIYTAAVAAIDRWTFFRRCAFLNATLSGATAMTAGITLHASSGGGLLLDSPTFVGLTAICDAGSKAQTYLNGPTPNGGAGVSVVVT